MNKNFMALCLAFAIYAGSFFVSLEAKASILITPTRVVFEDRDRFGVVTLVNNGDETTSYKMEWKFFEMQETGPAYKETTGVLTDFDLSKHIIFSPKRVTLAPGASQKIRLALRRPESIPEGDYHIHLGFMSVPNEADTEIKKIDNNAAKAGAAVKINVSYTIPVILRVGEPRIDTVIEDISFTRNQKTGMLQVAVPVARVGLPYSILGHLMLYHIDKNGNQERVGEISNAHIFPEVDKRLFDVHLIKEISGGSLRVVMYDYKFDRRKSDNFIYAERTFSLE